MAANSLNAAVAVDFSLIGTSLHAMYRKEKEGYRILLIPSLQEDNEGVSIEELMSDVKKLIKGVTGEEAANADEITDTLKSAADDPSKVNLDEVRIKLNMAYLYISKTDQEDILEYAFNVGVQTTGLIPKALQSIVSVDHLGLAIWNTERAQILNKMSIAKMEDYLGLPAEETAQE
ncbi:MAG: hypothetical protein NC337_13275 [Roseburia sp.]|nr:hypothetical protein [Roseburia sp.]